MEGLILHLQRFSTEDGPGIRTTVFFKGCPLHCRWCHNPESIAQHKQVQWIETRCIGCRTCLQVCAQGALAAETDGIHIDWELCQGCGKCVTECPGTALEMLGTDVQVEALVEELEKDRAFFNQSAGGVTLSGGEPLLQPVFALTLMEELHKYGIPVALDTCGVCEGETFKKALDLADMLLLDLKILDYDQHRFFTGGDNRIILQNLQHAVNHFRKHPEKHFWIRTPLIPGATVDPDNLKAIGAYIRENAADVVERWELCAFNNLCRDKYRRLGLQWDFAQQQMMTDFELEQCQRWACASGIDPHLVVTSGATRVETV